MGYGNLGDAATQDAIIENIRKRVPDADIVGFSLNPEDTRARHNIVSYSITHWHPRLEQSGPPSTSGTKTAYSKLKSLGKKIPFIPLIVRRGLNLLREVKHLVRTFKMLRSLDTLVIAGGGQLGDLWRGAWSHPYNVFKFSALTKLANRKLIFLNVGAGPLSNSVSRFFARCSVRLADYVSFRDRESLALIQQLGLKRAMVVFPDSVYALPIIQGDDPILTSTSKPLVGINPIGYCDPRIWAKKDQGRYVRYLKNLTTFCLWLLQQGYRLRIYPSELSVDLYACDDLKQQLFKTVPQAEVDGLFYPPTPDVNSLLAQMAQLDFVITSKFHGVIFSHLLAKPVVALSYHNKIDDLMRAAGHGQDCLNIETFDCERLKNTFLSVEERADGLKTLFRQRNLSNAQLLAAQFDGLFPSQNSEYGSALLETSGSVVVGSSK